MHFAIVSGFACGLSMWARLVDEGNDVKVYIDPGEPKERSETHTHVGEGLVPREYSWERLLAWAHEHDAIVFFDSSGLGDKAEEARASGLSVICGGSFCDELENDREFGFEVAREGGASIPPYKRFRSLSAARRAASSLDRSVYFKSDSYLGGDATHRCETAEDLVEYLDEIRGTGVPERTACILQDEVEGVCALSTARWWNGRTWVGPYQWTIEHKEFMNDDIGPKTGCSLNVVWFTQESVIADRLGWLDLTWRFRRENAPPGLYDLNVVVDDKGRPWFLEHTPRMGYDSEPTGFRLVSDLGAWLSYVATGMGGPVEFSSDLAVSTRLSVPPYPWEHVEWGDKKTCVGVRVRGTDGLWNGNFIAYEVRQNEKGDLEVACPEGIVGLSLAVGDELSSICEEVVEFAHEMRRVTSGIQFRTDMAKVLRKDAEALQKAGIPIHPGLLK